MTNQPRKHVARAVIAIIIGGLYLLNPTGGLIEFIPDVIPLAGNLDEAAATALVIYGIRELRGNQSNIITVK